MSLRLVDRHGLLSLPFIFVLGVVVSVTIALLNQLSPIAAIVVAYGYAWYLAIQTRLMFYFVLLLIAGGTLVATQAPDVTHQQVWLAVLFLMSFSAISHGTALVVTRLTGI
jgi:hypothetical protein